MKLYLLASSALALLSVVPSVYSQESTTSIVLKGSSASSLRGASKFLVKKVDEYALLSKDKGAPGGGGGGGGPPSGGDDGPGGDGDKKHGGPPSGPDDGPGPDHDHNKHGGPPDGPGGPDNDDQPGPPGPGHNHNHHDGPPGDDDCPPGMVGCDPATWGPGNKKPPKPPKPSKDDDDDDDGPPKPPHKHHHHDDDDDDEGDDDDFDNTREVPDIPYEIKKLGKGYCDTDNQLGHLNKCVELYDEYCKTDLLKENDDICEYLGYGGDDVVMAME